MKAANILKAIAVSTLAFSAVAAQTASAGDTIRLGHPSYGGNGCPAGSASASVTPDGKAITLLFDDYLVEAGGDNRNVVRKSCNISIPVHVPNGFSVSLIDADYRGFVDLPRGAQARLNSEYFFAGTRGPRFEHRFRGPYSNNYTKTHRLAATASVWSRCGADVNLRANTSMMARGRRNVEALATVDSADFKAGIVYHVRYRSCR